MASVVSNPKGFKVLKVSLVEITSIAGGMGICDSCNRSSFKGYYIAVMNRWYCPECYEQWLSRAYRYGEDEPIETKNFNRMCNLLNVNQ